MSACQRSYCTSLGRYTITSIERSTTHRHTTRSCGSHLPRLIQLLDPRGIGVTVTFTREKKS